VLALGDAQEALADELVDPGADLARRALREQAVRRQGVVPALPDPRGLCAAQDVGDVARAEALPGLDDAGEDLLREDLGVGNPRDLPEAHVAGPAGAFGGVELLAEVLAQRAVAAARAGREVPDVRQPLDGFVEVGAGVLDAARGGVARAVLDQALPA